MGKSNSGVHHRYIYRVEMNTRYNGVYHVLRTLKFMDMDDRRRSEQFIDTNLLTFVRFLDTNVDDF